MRCFESTSRRLLFAILCSYSTLCLNLLRRFNENVTANTSSHSLHDVIPGISLQKSFIETSSHNQNDDKLRNVLENAPSVDYFACCGTGHRFSKLSDAFFLAKQVGFSLRVFFGFCDTQEVWSFFFGPQPPYEVLTMTRKWNGTKDNLNLKVNNESPGFTRLIRDGNESSCRYEANRFNSDIEFYAGIRERFRDRDRVETFRQEHFHGKTVIGMHIRAGNGEGGDFERKNRTIHNVDEWSTSMSKLIIKMAKNYTDPPILFIATDTAHIISNFREMLRDVMPVVDLSQGRIDHGQGVLFGAQGNVKSEGSKCLEGWSDSFTDMMILSYADVVIAGRPSSFTQSLPMTMALATPKPKRKVLQSFCEVNPAATEVMCFEDLKDWCCRGVTSFSLQGIQRYDYRRMPRVDGLDSQEYSHLIKERMKSCIPKPTHRRDCLPYSMPSANGMQQVDAEEMRQFRLEVWKQGKKEP